MLDEVAETHTQVVADRDHALIVDRLVALARDASAQTDVIRGRVVGPEHAAIAHARISAEAVGAQVVRTTETDEDGRWTITFLDGEVLLDTSNEEINSHVAVKTEVVRVLSGLVRDHHLGRFYADGVLLTNVAAVSPGYPLRGRVLVAGEPFARGSPATGIPAAGEAWPDSKLLAAVGGHVGSQLSIGAASLRVTRVLIARPDQGGTFAELAAFWEAKKKEDTPTGGEDVPPAT